MSPLKKYLTDYPWSLRLEEANWERDGEQLLRIEAQCFDEQMRSQAYNLEELIKDETVMAMVLIKNDEVIGYIAGADLESEASSFDPHSDPRTGWGDFDTLYLDNVSILPEHRAFDAFQFMATEFIRYGKTLGYRQATMHARRANGLSTYCIRRLKFKRLKTIQNWYDCGEDFDYLLLPPELEEDYQTIPFWHPLLTLFRNKLQGTFVEYWFRPKKKPRR